jgi:hypothetical protein
LIPHFLAIHKVLQRQCASFGSKICSQIALAELCGAALIIRCRFLP